MELSKELKTVADEVTQLIRSDNYTDKICPNFLKKSMEYYPLNAGKRIRPALLLWCCGMLGGNLEKAKYAAAAVELYHNWTLVHDDIIDDDSTRRGKDSTHIFLGNYGNETFSLCSSDSRKFGRDFAVLTGDLQKSWSISMLLNSTKLGVPQSIVMSLVSDLVNTVSSELISGEAMDVEISYKQPSDVKPEDVDQIADLKTASLLSFCAVSGGKIALEEVDSNNIKLTNLATYAKSIGLAFQLKDDWLGIYSDIKSLGKPICSDIIAAKPSSIILTTLNNLKDSQYKTFKNYLGKKDLNEKDVLNIRELVNISGADDLIKKRIQALHYNAERGLSDFKDNKYKDLLLQLGKFLVERTS